MRSVHSFPADLLANMVEDAHARTLEVVQDLGADQLMGPQLPIVNPFLWEVGHVAWFNEKWILRHLERRPALRADADLLYDSSAIPHDARWALPFPSFAQTLEYKCRVKEGTIGRLRHKQLRREEAYFYFLTLFHEDMHGEAFIYMRQTLGYPAPRLAAPSNFSAADAGTPDLSGDIEIPGGSFLLGATPDDPFVFDNEKWAHPVEIQAFRIARYPVTSAEFEGFVRDAGYERPEFWDEQGWLWRRKTGARHPAYWEDHGGKFKERRFDRIFELHPSKPVVHVNWHEANAYCRWAGRRLPTEAEWEAAASALPADKGGRLGKIKVRFPWGDGTPNAARANLDAYRLDRVPVTALAEGDSRFGCRQMIGNVWEWTASAFSPYPGFVPDPYKEYSQPWFGTRKVLRGGAWATRGRLLRNTWRNFFPPDRRDIFAGFRTCAM